MPVFVTRANDSPPSPDAPQRGEIIGVWPDDHVFGKKETAARGFRFIRVAMPMSQARRCTGSGIRRFTAPASLRAANPAAASIYDREAGAEYIRMCGYQIPLEGLVFDADGYTTMTPGQFISSIKRTVPQ